MKEYFIHWLNQDSEDFQFILYAALLVLLIVVEIIIPLRKHPMRKGRWLANFFLPVLNVVSCLYYRFPFGVFSCKIPTIRFVLFIPLNIAPGSTR